VKQELWQLLGSLLPQREPGFRMDDIQGHEGIASFVCALTALCVVAGRCIVVGDRRLGYIVLPPVEFWGESVGSSGKWARDALRNNLTGVRRRFNNVALYRDNNPWTP